MQYQGYIQFVCTLFILILPWRGALGYPKLDVFGNVVEEEPDVDTSDHSILQDYETPPVIYEQTKGPLYEATYHYLTICCNVTEGATVRWVYYNHSISMESTENTTLQMDHSTAVQNTTLTTPNSSCLQYSKPPVHGYVQCLVSNAYGSTFGDKVLVRQPVLNRTGDRTEYMYVDINDHVTMSCGTDIIHIPPADISWQYFDQYHKRWRPLESNKYFLCNLDNTTCILSNFGKIVNTTFKCVATSKPISRTEVKKFEIRVRSTTDVFSSFPQPLNLVGHISSPSEVKVRLGESLKLQCAFRGGTHVRIHWRFLEYDVTSCLIKGLPIKHGASGGKYIHRKRSQILEISHLGKQDEGYYICTAKNDHEEYSHRMRVRIVVPPTLGTPDLQGQIVMVGGILRMNCSTSEAIPKPHTKWWINSQPILTPTFGHFRLEDEGSTLVLENATRADSGSIVCNVSNSVGYTLGYRFIIITERSTAEDNLTPDISQHLSTTPPISTSLTSQRSDTTAIHSWSPLPFKQIHEQTNSSSGSPLPFKQIPEQTNSSSGSPLPFKQIHEQTDSSSPADNSHSNSSDILVETGGTISLDIDENSAPRVAAQVIGSALPADFIFDQMSADLGTMYRNIHFSCSDTVGCNISSTAELYKLNSDPAHGKPKSRTYKSKVFHESYNSSYALEKRDVYDAKGNLVKVKLRLTTNGFSTNGKLKDTTSIDIRFYSWRTHIKWGMFYKHPFNNLSCVSSRSNTCVQHRSKTKVTIKVDERKMKNSISCKCWSDKKGVEFQVSNQHQKDMDLCRWTCLDGSTKKCFINDTH